MPEIPRIHIKNMVCQRRILTVEHIFRNISLHFHRVIMGEVELVRTLSAEELARLKSALSDVGFEVIETRLNKPIGDVKLVVLDYLGNAWSRQAST